MNVITSADMRVPIKSWADFLGAEALEQACNLANLPFIFKHVALMPDVHSGYGMPVGGVMATTGVIIPNAVGVDIGCGMQAIRTEFSGLEVDVLKAIMGRVRKSVPVGFDHHKEPRTWEKFDLAPDFAIIQQELASARKQLGTLGGGNHFIEFQIGTPGYDSENTDLWVMIHSGSRNFGLKTANWYHKLALKLCQQWFSDLPHPDLAFLPITTNEGKEYKTAMDYCLDFAKANRDMMMDQVILAMKEELGLFDITWRGDVHHNYAAFENHFGHNVLVHRKGATRARKDEYGIIPGSMGSNSYIVVGKGNPDSFESSSHGAGRRMGRNQAKKTLVLENEQAKMDGIVHGLRTVNDLDEAPGAYKDIDEVMEQQKDLIVPVVKLRPIGVIKG